jgi:hypothetical protein
MNCFECTHFKGMERRCNSGDMVHDRNLTLDHTGCTSFSPGPFNLTDTGVTIFPNGTSDFEHLSDMRPILRNFSVALQRGIVLRNPHRSRSTPVFGGPYLHINFWSTPNTEESTMPTTIGTIFGIRLEGGQNDGLTPTGTGIQLKDPHGKTAAEVHGNTIFVLFDLPHGRNAGKLLEFILMEYSKITPEIRARYLATLEAEQVIRNKTNFIEFCMEKHLTHATAHRELIKQNEETLQTLSTDISAKVVALNNKHILLKELESRDLAAHHAEEYQTLLALPHVKEVEVEGTKIKVLTNTIYYEYKAQWYELGDYQIVFDRETMQITNLRVEELTKQKYYHHPHVFEREHGNNVCMGNIGEGVRHLLRNYEYAVAVQVMIEFLHNIKQTEQYLGWLTSFWKPLPKEEVKKRKLKAA